MNLGIYGSSGPAATFRRIGAGRVTSVEIETLEGTMRADIGDWIIKGLKGELYPCKPDVFAMKYEPAAQGEENAMITSEKVICPWCEQSVKTHACVKYHRTIRGAWCSGGGASPVEREIKARDLKTPHDEDPGPEEPT